MKKIDINGIISLVSLLSPAITLAQLDLEASGSNFRMVILNVVRVIDTIIPILFLLTFMAFFWGVSKTILKSSSPGDIEKGRSYVLWSIAILFILVAFRGIIFFFMREFQLGTDAPSVPGVLLPSRS